MLILPECIQLLYLGRVRTSGEVWGGRGERGEGRGAGQGGGEGFTWVG
jgi:hypothetical protein